MCEQTIKSMQFARTNKMLEKKKKNETNEKSQLQMAHEKTTICDEKW